MGIPREQFLYDLRLWELKSIVRGYRARYHNLWLATRWSAWIYARVMGAKIESPEDLMKFQFEGGKTLAELQQDNEERQRMIEEARAYNAQHANAIIDK